MLLSTRPSVEFLGGAAAFTALLAALLLGGDEEVNTLVSRLPTTIIERVKTVSDLGEPGRLFFLLVVFSSASALVTLSRGRSVKSPFRRAMFFLTAGGLATALSLALKFAVGRARPIVETGSFHVMPFSSLQGMDSWPSSQAACLGALAVALSATWPRCQAAWWFLATLMSALRVVSGVHWASDVAAGLALGAATAMAIAGAMSMWRQMLRELAVLS
jgi:membrane-associated phospholipid phosphatase